MNQKAQVLTSIAALVIVTLIVASNYYHLGTEAAAPTDVNVLERATKGCEYRLSAKCLARSEEPKVPSSGQHKVLARPGARSAEVRMNTHEARCAECRLGRRPDKAVFVKAVRIPFSSQSPGC